MGNDAGRGWKLSRQQPQEEANVCKTNDSDYIKIYIAILRATERMLNEGTYNEVVLDRITSYLDRFKIPKLSY
jgi:hypothetical protein